ncbi:MAG: Lin0512 family protein [Candidatus Helarchaeota archaeon]
MIKKFIVQIGMGVDQHGHNMDATKAAIKAVKNAISNNCLAGLNEILNIKDPLEMIVDILIAKPNNTTINEKKVLRAIPFGKKSIQVIDGGMIASGIYIKELGDINDNMLVVNAAITVSFDIN